MAAKAFGKLRSVKTVERTTGMLEALGVITSEPRGLLGNSYTIHFDWLAEIRAAGVRKRDGSNPTFNPTNGGVDGAACRVERPEMSDYATENVGLPIRGINQEPTFNQPTTTESSEPDVSDWAAVEVEVSKCGVNQARAAVHLALSTPGMTPVFIRENLRYWRQHKTGWSHAAVVLYRRLLQVEPGKSADEDWPEFDVPGCQAKLDLERLAIQNAEECRRQLERRKEYLEEREQCAAEHANLGVTLESLMAPIDPDFAREMARIQRRRRVADERVCVRAYERACRREFARELCPCARPSEIVGPGMSFSCTSGRQCGANMNQQTLWNGDGQIVVATRAAAAAKISPLKPSMLRHVFDFVSERGATDEEIAAALRMRDSTARARRVELLTAARSAIRPVVGDRVRAGCALFGLQLVNHCKRDERYSSKLGTNPSNGRFSSSLAQHEWTRAASG